MKAVHFGAGNIGRGFIGLLLYQSGYQTTFVDVNQQLIQALNEKKQYNVMLAAEKSEKQTVENVSGINSLEDRDKVIDAIVEADIITTAIGPTVLPLISELLAQGLTTRKKYTGSPLTIIACENMIDGSSFLKEQVFNHIREEEKASFIELYHFPNAAVDRIVPNQVNEDILEVAVEPYYEWVVEAQDIKTEEPKVQGITYVNDLTPYIERKLFTVNTGHAVAAYLGYYLRYSTIKEAMDDHHVQVLMKGALEESGEALIQTYGFNREEHQQYINTIIQRFMNPYISDDVTRVGRGPLRKLGVNDRLIRPATLYMDVTGKEPTHLATVIAATLQYTNTEDEEAVRLQKKIKEVGYGEALQNIADLDAEHPLINIVLRKIEELAT